MPSSSTSTSTGTKPALGPPKKKAGFQQKGLLAGAIKRKTSGGEKDGVKRKLSASSSQPGSGKATVAKDADEVKPNPTHETDKKDALSPSGESPHLDKKQKTEK